MPNALPDIGTRTERRSILRSQIHACNSLIIAAPPNPENCHRDRHRSPNIRHCAFSTMCNETLTPMAGFLIEKYSTRKFSGLQSSFCVVSSDNESESGFTSLLESIDHENSKQLRLISAGITFAARPRRETAWR